MSYDSAPKIFQPVRRARKYMELYSSQQIPVHPPRCSFTRIIVSFRLIGSQEGRWNVVISAGIPVAVISQRYFVTVEGYSWYNVPMDDDMRTR